MKRFAPGVTLAVFALALALVPAARAQVFGNTTLVTGDSDVLNTGTTVLAYDVSGIATTLHGVNFSGSLTNGTVTLSLSNFNDADNNGVDGTNLSTALTNTLIDNVFNVNTTATFTLGHLTPGATYALQIFAGTTGVGLGTSELQDGMQTGTNSHGTSGSDSTAYYTTETFTAGSSGIETIDFVPVEDNFNDSFVILDAANLRLIPEPSTWAMLLAGVLLFGAVRARVVRA